MFQKCNVSIGGFEEVSEPKPCTAGAKPWKAPIVTQDGESCLRFVRPREQTWGTILQLQVQARGCRDVMPTLTLKRADVTEIRIAVNIQVEAALKVGGGCGGGRQLLICQLAQGRCADLPCQTCCRMSPAPRTFLTTGWTILTSPLHLTPRITRCASPSSN